MNEIKISMYDISYEWYDEYINNNFINCAKYSIKNFYLGYLINWYVNNTSVHISKYYVELNFQ